uniref:Uncharacterized protein n=1 Tax=Triticum urartu TaxID=4572 RepID=A0A8R7V6L7_TRIUA
MADGEHLVPLGAAGAGDVAARPGAEAVRAGLDLDVGALAGADAAHPHDAHEEVSHRLHQVVRRLHRLDGLAGGREPPGDDAGRGGRVVIRPEAAARVSGDADMPVARRHPFLAELRRVHFCPVGPRPWFTLRLRLRLRLWLRWHHPGVHHGTVRTMHHRAVWPMHRRRHHVAVHHGRRHHGTVWPVHGSFLHDDDRRLRLRLLHLHGGLRRLWELRWELPGLFRRDLGRRRVVSPLGRPVLRRRRGRHGRLVVVVDLEADLAADPAEQAALLEREVDDALLAAARELGAVDADAAEEVVLAAPGAAAGGVEAAVVVERDVERLGVHGGRVGHGELEALVPLRVEVPRHGPRALALSVEVGHRVGAGGAEPVLGHQVPRVHHLHRQPAHHLPVRVRRPPVRHGSELGDGGALSRGADDGK